MKKLVFTYVGFVLIIIIVSSLFSLKKNVRRNDEFTLTLPETINVYFKDEGKTQETNMEDYIVCVVSAEVPASFHEEAIKAQAVAARTYVYNKYKKFTEDPSLAPDEHKDASVCTDYTHCCAYYSKEKLQEIHGEEWMKNTMIKS
ncbi:MAG: hypothetical protein IJ332_03590 [Clostridia bacterium]|nr:hypothetical protein [Clostridia bacterium]